MATVLLMLSINYEMTAHYSQCVESLHLALWILVKILKDDKSQLFNLIAKFYEKAKENYDSVLQEEQDIFHIINLVIPKEEVNQQDDKLIKNLSDKYQWKMYYKFNHQESNKSSFIVRPAKTVQSPSFVITQPANSLLPQIDLAKMKEALDISQKLVQSKLTTNHQSYTSLEDGSKKLMTTDASEWEPKSRRRHLAT